MIWFKGVPFPSICAHGGNVQHMKICRKVLYLVRWLLIKKSLVKLFCLDLQKSFKNKFMQTILLSQFVLYIYSREKIGWMQKSIITRKRIVVIVHSLCPEVPSDSTKVDLQWIEGEVLEGTTHKKPFSGKIMASDYLFEYRQRSNGAAWYGPKHQVTYGPIQWNLSSAYLLKAKPHSDKIAGYMWALASTWSPWTTGLKFVKHPVK